MIERLQIGNGRWETAKLNSRQQITELALGTSQTDTSLWKVNYEYGEIDASGNLNQTKNNGNIAKQTISFAGLTNPFVQTYKYDSVNRLTEARETSGGNQTWHQTFDYDRYGNRTSFGQIIGSQQLVLNNINHPSIDANTNRFTAGQGYTYDYNGNIINDPAYSGRSFTFNGDNKQTEVRDVNNALVGRYFYDGDGKRVKKEVYSGGQITETTVFVYSGGKLVAEYSTAEPPDNPTINYTATDHLQTPRVITDKMGNVTSRRDFMPFGEEIVPDGTYRTTNQKYSLTGDNVRQKFTGYQKDLETGLDFAEARYYNNQHGRFTAVDPLLASGKSANPQTFNRYVYTGNNPTNITDPLGLDWYKDKSGVRRWSTDGRTFDWTTDGQNYAEGATRDTVNESWTRIVGDDFVYEGNNGFVALDPRSTLWRDGYATRGEARGQMERWYNSDPASRALVGELGSRAPASMKFLGLLMLSGASGGAGAAGAVGTATFGLVVGGETLLAHQAIHQVGESEHESAMMGNTRSSGTIDPFKVNFSQDSIKDNFSSGGSIDSLAEGLKNGSINPQSVEAIRLVERNGEMFTLDNRRLEAFRRANVPISYRMATPSEINAQGWKFTTKNGGKSVRIRGR